MSKTAEPAVPAVEAPAPAGRSWADVERSWAVLRWLLVIATTWFLLKELAPLLRPLLLAVFLAYVVFPVRVYVQGHVRAGPGPLALLVGLVIILVGLGVLTYGDVVDLTRELPRLQERTRQSLAEAERYTSEHVPWLGSAIAGTASAEERGTSRLREALGDVANVTVGVLFESVAVAFYLILMLLEAGRLPRRMRRAFADDRAERILATVGNINAAMASYLKAKVIANVALALPVMLILWACGVKFVILWGALTFFANFVPYLGSVVACALPILFGFLDMDFGWRPIAAAVLLPAVHVASAYVIEPALTGKAVDLSPLVVLIALSFWGLCWGVTGMVLAVPLTAMLKIILESAPSTRPIGGLMGGE
jgi:AI-2 transport protein TqsA